MVLYLSISVCQYTEKILETKHLTRTEVATEEERNIGMREKEMVTFPLFV